MTSKWTDAGSRVLVWVAGLTALAALGAGIGAMLIPAAFLWLIFGGS